MIKELDIVVLERHVPEHGLICGDIGTIVHAYGNTNAYEVEFANGEGETMAVVTLEASDIRVLSKTDILHVRELKAA